MLEARFRTHQYAWHSHESYAVGLTHAGVQSFRCRGRDNHGVPGSILSINPDEAHNGRSGATGGYAYTMFYIAPQVMVSALEDAHERSIIAPAFVAPLLTDPLVARHAQQLRSVLLASSGTLERQTALHALLWSLCARHTEAGSRPSEPRPAPSARLERVRDFLHANFSETVSLEQLSNLAGISRFRLNSGFQRAFGLPPHAYLTRLRLSAARSRIEAGDSIAGVSTEVGFVDQSHLTRKFKGWYGTTPGAFQQRRRTNVQFTAP